MSWVHHSGYRFYIQKYPQGSVSFQRIDVEEKFQCRFMKMDGVVESAVKNVYTEDYAEIDGVRVHAPLPNKLRYSSSDIILKLRWRSDECADVLAAADEFFKYVTGQKLEWYDTFRGRYLELILTDSPTVEYQKLNSPVKYLVMSYKFKNFAGKIFKQNQL